MYHPRECVPLDAFACYEADFTTVQESCYATLEGCERGRAESIALALKQHRDRIGPCTLYRTKPQL